METDYNDTMRWLYRRYALETTDLNDTIIGKAVTDLHVGRYGTWLEFEGGAELHVEPKINNGDCKDGNAYATLVTRVTP